MIKIKNYSSYQSYKDRRPPWIRLHKTLLDNYEFQTMTAESRALLPMLWLLASENKDPKSGEIEDDTTRISFRLRLPKSTVDSSLREIASAGFIEIIQCCNETVTEPYLNRNHLGIQTVTPETETETETEKHYARFQHKKIVRDKNVYLTAKKKQLSGKCLDGFQRFWTEFAYPHGKAQAADAWLSVYREDEFEAIIEGAKHEARERPSLTAQGKTPKWAQGWLTARRWEDLKETEFVEKKLVLPPPPEELIRLKKEAENAQRTTAG